MLAIVPASVLSSGMSGSALQVFHYLTPRTYGQLFNGEDITALICHDGKEVAFSHLVQEFAFKIVANSLN